MRFRAARKWFLFIVLRLPPILFMGKSLNRLRVLSLFRLLLRSITILLGGESRGVFKRFCPACGKRVFLCIFVVRFQWLRLLPRSFWSLVSLKTRFLLISGNRNV